MATVSENGPRKAGFLRSKESIMYQCVPTGSSARVVSPSR